MRDCVKKGHAARQQEKHFNERQRDIDAVEDHGRVTHLRYQLTNGWTWGFRTQNVHIAPAGEGNNRQHKDKDAHTADPNGKTPPERHTARQRFNIGQNRGTGCREAGDNFKKSAKDVWNGSADDKRHCPENSKQYPGKGDNGKPFPGIDGMIFRFQEKGAAAQSKQNCDGDEKRNGLPLMVQQTDKGGQQH